LEHIKYDTNIKKSLKEVHENNYQNIERNEKNNGEENQKTILQKQVETGEITPFEAVFKQSAAESGKGYNIMNKYSDLFN
jgi:hypothetical protein